MTIRHWTNLFPLVDAEDLEVEYRLVEIHDLLPGESYEKNANLLLKRVRSALRAPAALIRRGDHRFIAIPVDVADPPATVPLAPEVARLAPLDERNRVSLGRLTGEGRSVAISFLRSALASCLRQPGLWHYGAYYYKQPLARHPSSTVDVYPGFDVSVVPVDGTIAIAIDPTFRYVDARPLSQLVRDGDGASYATRHCLYRMARDWFVIELMSILPQSVSERDFIPKGAPKAIDVLRYTQRKWPPEQWPEIAALDPDAPAIAFRYLGGDEHLFGALELCRLVRWTSEPEVRLLHDRSILPPRQRIADAVAVVDRHLGGLRLGRGPIAVARSPLSFEGTVLPLPSLRFGQGRVLSAGPFNGSPDRVAPDQYARRRLDLVLDAKAGPPETSDFDAQYLIAPASTPREILTDFERRLTAVMSEVAHRPYALKRFLYQPSSSGSLYDQREPILALARERELSGHATLVLPERGHQDLHNYLKSTLAPSLRFQCVATEELRSFYRVRPDGTWEPRPDKLGRLRSYVLYCAFGLMVANRRWLYALGSPLHYDAYVGIDVHNHVVGASFIYSGGQEIVFRDYGSKQKERLTGRLLRRIVADDMGHDLQRLGAHPRSLVVHRDGHTFEAERAGLAIAAQELKARGILAPNACVGIVDIRKTDADAIRLAEGASPAEVRNPTVGSRLLLSDREGIVATTAPIRGTANPLNVVIDSGPLDIHHVLEDVFALAQLNFAAPDKYIKLPLTLKLTDDFLRSVAGRFDEDAAEYGDEPVEAVEALR